MRPLHPGDLQFSVALHERALPTGLFRRLGPAFLRVYHASFIASPVGVALLVQRDDVPVGFLLGAARNRAHLRWVLRHQGPELAAAGALALARRPRLAAWFVHVRLARYVRAMVKLLRPHRSSRNDVQVSSAASPDVAVLAHIAVAPEARGQGVGQVLVRAFVDAAKAAGVASAHLVTQSGHLGAGGFYEALGWRLVAEQTDRDQVAMSAYRCELRAPSDER